MEKKKALLVVAGGRGVPDFQALFCVRPHLVVILTSEEGWDEEGMFADAVRSLPQYEQLLPTRHIPSYDMEVTKETCMQICQLYPQNEWEWTFSIGSSPKILGIGAYEVAKKMNIPCIYMDGLHEKVVSLVSPFASVPPNIFHLKVDDYLKIYGRQADISPTRKLYRNMVEKWGYIAQVMVLSPAGLLFTQQAWNKKSGELIQFPSNSPELQRLLDDLEDFGAITVDNRNNDCMFASSDFASFLGTGDWLEVYVWNEAKNKGFADDCQWGYNIKSTVTTGEGKAPNELDGLFTFKAQLILVECKTGKNVFKGKNHYLDIMNDKSDMLGRSYVTKVFVTNDNISQSSYVDFAKRAEARKIVVITAENLPDVGQMLEQEAKNPKYKRK